MCPGVRVKDCDHFEAWTKKWRSWCKKHDKCQDRIPPEMPSEASEKQVALSSLYVKIYSGSSLENGVGRDAGNRVLRSSEGVSGVTLAL